MAIDVHWDNDECNILRVEFIGRWTWNELNAALAQATAMMDEQQCQRADIIADLKQITSVPSLFLPHVRSILQQRDPRMNMTILVGMNDLVRTIWGIVSQAYGLLGRQERYFMVKTVDEARQLLAQKAAAEQTQISV
jgi:hypothetical protein